ncbi:DNA-3-methyladenine glycosylase I [Dictyobacter vulcani]|uniref:DNA-3-methyladenine glycosylase I n=1 Tax=Dictyobacter vulcani TaxID=2607529 RepID=A0A5J4KPD2_9CHLR|nr:DNA-3-methyladenine glycosylase I [Dictyobacter vulcani]GER91244.1 DNA-3-methyladenine glycosylase I [Dictyobacter vulcani]
MIEEIRIDSRPDETSKVRCAWAQTHELFFPYHDEEWGVPVHDDRLLFEMLNLEGAQAGLSWLTVLKKRENYRRAFDDFVAEKIVHYDDEKKAHLLANEGIIRNRLKINAVIENASAFLAVQREFGSFDSYIWQFVDGQPLVDAQQQDAVARSVVMSKDLKKRGFRFVGATICYAFMQAIGMVNDHSPECFRARMISQQ